MPEDPETHESPPEEPPPEVLAEQLEKAAEKWESKAESEVQAADGDVAKQILYQATADAMRHAKKAIEEKPHSESADSENTST